MVFCSLQDSPILVLVAVVTNKQDSSDLNRGSEVVTAAEPNVNTTLFKDRHIAVDKCISLTLIPLHMCQGLNPLQIDEH